MRIVFLNEIDELWKPYFEKLRSEFPNVEFINQAEHGKIEDYLPEADGIVCTGFNPDILEVAKRLKIIFIPWTGVDALPLDKIREKGDIIVSNTHGNAEIVAERAFSLCLALLGRTVEFHNNLSKGIWGSESRQKYYDNFWVSLRNRSCGIAGFGKIGKELAKLLKVFNCRITGLKKRPPSEEDLELADKVTSNLDEMIAESDIIFVILPLTDETRNLFNWEVLSKMKGKYLINVGRGAVISEEALYRALKEGVLAGAAIDTWYHYPTASNPVVLPFSYPIHTFKNVVLSPHVGSSTIEGFKGMIEETFENIRAFLKTGEPIYKIDLNLKY
ncbi:MAG: hypothetical protein PWQ20_200 [Thermotogaceae bacterium]|jgi:phosphoglycerate dehydrogenase-like enzyme|nr:hypothetical protein [Thermotogaceae bacterium]MDN5337130.1 hypothetical protein [Thermotogaceae bacterium]